MCGCMRTQARAHSCAHVGPQGRIASLCVSASPTGTLDLWTPWALWSLHTRAYAQHHTRHSEVWLQLRGGPPSQPAGSPAPPCLARPQALTLPISVS